jgi:uncharacterized Fe-S cluster-containing radical SAM superfamily protein
MNYDPVARHKETESRVIRKKIGGDEKKFARFRFERWQGGILAADSIGCGLRCRFCWVWDEEALSGEIPAPFFSPQQVAQKFLRLAMEKKTRRIRISGGEPLIGREHLLKVLAALQNKKMQILLETNGILLGEDESYARDLALFPFVHARVSLKGANEEEFARLTGADPSGFHLQLAGLNNLVKAGVSAHPAVMASFSPKESLDRLYAVIWKINPRMQSEIEREEVILYPRVIENLKAAGIRYYSGHKP